MRLLAILSLVILTTIPVRAQVPVSGYVLGLDDGDMLAGAEVQLLDESGLALTDRPALQTDEDGHFLFEDVPAGKYMLEVVHTYTTETGPLRYEVRTDQFTVSDQHPKLAVGLSRAGALLERQIKETDPPTLLDESVWVRRIMLSPQVKLDQSGTPIYPVDVVSAVVASVN